MKVINWELIDESTDKERLPVGAYVVVITGAKDNPSREYIEFTYDIAEGPYKDHFSDDWGQSNPWAHNFYRSYKETAFGMFKSFLKRLEESNPDFNIAEWQATSDEQALTGLLVGIVQQEEEYEANDGSIKTRTNVAKIIKADDVRNGNFKLLDKKLLDGGSATTAKADVYDDIPFM